MENNTVIEYDVINEINFWRGQILLNPSMKEHFWWANYQGKTKISQWAMAFSKSNYKNFNYVPWSAMVKVLELLDPASELRVIRNSNGGIVHSDSSRKEFFDNSVEGDKTKTTNIARLDTVFWIEIEIFYLGKNYHEVFVIQNKSYDFISMLNNGEDLNRALASAKRRAISRVTGIGFEFYAEIDETETDVDFSSSKTKSLLNEPKTSPKPVAKPEVKPEVKEEEKTPEPVAKTKKVTKNTEAKKVTKAKEPDGTVKEEFNLLQGTEGIVDTKVETPGDTGALGEYSDAVNEAALLLKENAKEFETITLQINKKLELEGKPTINLEGSVSEIAEVVNGLSSPDTFLTALQKVLKNSAGGN